MKLFNKSLGQVPLFHKSMGNTHMFGKINKTIKNNSNQSSENKEVKSPLEK